ncbi:MAG: heme-binding protein [Planctomycetia bacterium]|nr:heme-binding protein [Planctomycetia bacterium]
MSFRRHALPLVIAFAVGVASVAFAAEEDAVRKPMMIPEAKLPAGFPPPGPVGEVITKTYPAHRLARVTAGDRGNDGSFMKLFRHIKRNEIAMTAPVEMVLDEEGDEKQATTESMAFLYGDAAIGVVGPDPADPSVVVEDVPETTVVSLGVRGSYGEDRFAGFVEKLRDWLTAHPEWVAAGPPRTLAYNSPFVPGVLKYAEVQIPVVPAPKPVRP